jgi:hypothetical protein
VQLQYPFGRAIEVAISNLGKESECLAGRQPYIADIAILCASELRLEMTDSVGSFSSWRPLDFGRISMLLAVPVLKTFVFLLYGH